jgi:hypothetical protein
LIENKGKQKRKRKAKRKKIRKADRKMKKMARFFFMFEIYEHFFIYNFAK